MRRRTGKALTRAEYTEVGNYKYLSMGGLLIATLVAATSVSQQRTPEQKESERFVRRFNVQSGGWIRESEVPADPQQTPLTIIWEVSLYPPGTKPTANQRKAANDLVERSYQSAQKNDWFDFDRATADGYRLMFGDDIHYANEKHILDDAVLDPERPEFLMYYTTRQGRKLAGYMFLTSEPLSQGPQIGGPLTVWHYHTLSLDTCFLQGLLVVGLPENGRCARGIKMRRTPEMLHVWLIDHPSGPFASQMGIDSSLLADLLDRRYRDRGY